MAKEKMEPEKNLTVSKQHSGKRTLPKRFNDSFGQPFLPAP